MKIHTSLISWIVNLLLPTRNVTEGSTEQFQNLLKDVNFDNILTLFLAQSIHNQFTARWIRRGNVFRR